MSFPPLGQGSENGKSPLQTTGLQQSRHAPGNKVSSTLFSVKQRGRGGFHYNEQDPASTTVTNPPAALPDNEDKTNIAPWRGQRRGDRGGRGGRGGHGESKLIASGLDTAHSQAGPNGSKTLVNKPDTRSDAQQSARFSLGPKPARDEKGNIIMWCACGAIYKPGTDTDDSIKFHFEGCSDSEGRLFPYNPKGRRGGRRGHGHSAYHPNTSAQRGRGGRGGRGSYNPTPRTTESSQLLETTTALPSGVNTAPVPPHSKVSNGVTASHDTQGTTALSHQDLPLRPAKKPSEANETTSSMTPTTPPAASSGTFNLSPDQLGELMGAAMSRGFFARENLQQSQMMATMTAYQSLNGLGGATGSGPGGLGLIPSPAIDGGHFNLLLHSPLPSISPTPQSSPYAAVPQNTPITPTINTSPNTQHGVQQLRYQPENLSNGIPSSPRPRIHSKPRTPKDQNQKGFHNHVRENSAGGQSVLQLLKTKAFGKALAGSNKGENESRGNGGRKLDPTAATFSPPAMTTTPKHNHDTLIATACTSASVPLATRTEMANYSDDERVESEGKQRVHDNDNDNDNFGGIQDEEYRRVEEVMRLVGDQPTLEVPK